MSSGKYLPASRKPCAVRLCGPLHWLLSPIVVVVEVVVAIVVVPVTVAMVVIVVMVRVHLYYDLGL